MVVALPVWYSVAPLMVAVRNETPPQLSLMARLMA